MPRKKPYSILCAEETNFAIFGTKKPPKIWPAKNKVFNENCVPNTVNHVGGSVMTWLCTGTSVAVNLVFIESTLNKMVYFNILIDNVIPSVENWVCQATGSFNKTMIPNICTVIIPNT